MKDPTAALEAIVALAEKAKGFLDNDPTARDLAKAILEMDTWLRKGGTLPAPWKEGRRR
jgi:hypothetical protein